MKQNCSARVVALDVGEKRTGVAVGEDGVCVKKECWRTGEIRSLADKVEKLNPQKVVLGYPKHGKDSKVKKIILSLKNELLGRGIDVRLFNEWMTTRMSKDHLRKLGYSEKEIRKKGLADALAAEIMLYDYMYFGEKG